jgi:PKD repeat protein
MICGSASALPDWIQNNKNQFAFNTANGNTIVYNNSSGNSHLTDFFYNGINYGGLPNTSHQVRGYTLYEAFYLDSSGTMKAGCNQVTTTIKQIIYADESVAVIESRCPGTTVDTMWRYVIPKNQSGFYETERKTIKVYYESQNNQQVQFINTSQLETYVSDRGGHITRIAGYTPLFTQFSKENIPFEWTAAYDKNNNVSLAWIHTGSDNLARTAHRRYNIINGNPEYQVDFAGAGERSRTEMPLGALWFETWKGIVKGDANEVKAKALSLVGHKVDEPINPFFSVTTIDGQLNVKTGAIDYDHKPYLNYDVPHASGNFRMITEYPFVNNLKAETGTNLTSGEDTWNSTYRDPDRSFAWVEYTIGNGSYKIRNQRTAYKDADGFIWNINITALTSGIMKFSIKYDRPLNYSTSVTNNTFSVKTIDAIEGEYGLTLIFPEFINVSTSGYVSNVSLPERYMNKGDTTSFTIYGIPHKWSNPASVETFHSREKTSLKIPYRVLQPGLEWIPTDTVTAYEGYVTDEGYTIHAYSEEGTHPIQIFSDKKISLIQVNIGTITYYQLEDGTIFGQWTVPRATVGKIDLLTRSSVILIPLPGFTNPPTDPDSDGFFEDLNANNRKDFNDVVLMFNQMQWIAANEPSGAFDFNGNGRIDFNDIVKLFGEI